VKKRRDLSALGNRITHKTLLVDEEDKFKKADIALGVDDDISAQEAREKVVRKSAAITIKDLEILQLIKDNCLNHKIVLNDSEVIRLGLSLIAKLSEEDLIKASKEITKLPTGRPKGS
jgi:hypothetical protein